MNIFYSIVKNIFIWTVPLLLVLYSIAFLSINSEIHKETLVEMNFYGRVEDILTTQKEDSLENGISGIIVNLTIRELVNQEWLQSLTERNVDLITAWLAGNEDNLAFFLPTSQIEKSLRANINQKVKEELKADKSQIDTCTQEDAQAIQREGFDPDGDFCLPQSVKNGDEDLLSFLGADNSNNVLDSLYRNNPLPGTGETVNLNSLDSLYKISENQFFRLTNVLRDLLILLREIWIVVLVTFIGILVAILLLAKTSGKAIISELRHIFWATGLSTAILSVTVIAIGGGSVYLNSLITQSLTDFVSSEIINLLALAAVRITFNLVSFAFWISLALIALSGILYGLEKSGLLEKKGGRPGSPVGNSGKNELFAKTGPKPKSKQTPPNLSKPSSVPAQHNLPPNTTKPNSKPENQYSQNRTPTGYEPHEILKEHPEFPKVNNIKETQPGSQSSQAQPVFESSSLLNDDSEIGNYYHEGRNIYQNSKAVNYDKGSSIPKTSENKPSNENVSEQSYKNPQETSEPEKENLSSRQKEIFYQKQNTASGGEVHKANTEKSRSRHDAYTSSSRFNQNQEKSKYSSLSSKHAPSSHRPHKNKVIEGNNNKSRIAGL